MSAQSLKTSIWNLIDWKDFLAFVIELAVLGTICFAAKCALELFAINSIITLCVLGSAYILCIFLLNKNKIFTAMQEINALH